MIKTIFIYEHNDCYKIAREVITSDGLPIEYGPVYIIEKLNFDLEAFSTALFKSFDFAGEVLRLPPFTENKKVYEDYKKYILNEFKEKSILKQMKNSTLFILEMENREILVMPTIATKRGNVGDEERYKKISTYRKLKTQIAQEIMDLMDEYKLMKSE